MPQVRAQHGAFALLTVRLKLSVLANSALTGCLRSFFIHFEMHVNQSTAMCLSDTLGSIGDECRCVPGTVCIVPEDLCQCDLSVGPTSDCDFGTAPVPPTVSIPPKKLF